MKYQPKGFTEKRLRAWEAGTISGNTEYKFYSLDEYVNIEAESRNWKQEQTESWKEYLKEWMDDGKEYIREKLVGCQIMLDFMTQSEVAEILNRYEDEINEIAEANGF